MPRLAFLTPLLVLVLAPWPSTGAEGLEATAVVRSSIPGVVAACRAESGREALADRSFDLVEWSEAPGAVAVRRIKPESGQQKLQRVEVSGRLHAARPLPGNDGWIRFQARCDFVKGHEVALSVDIERQLLPQINVGLPRATEGGAVGVKPPAPEFQAAPAGGPKAGAALPPNFQLPPLFGVLKPTVAEVPYELPVTRRQDDFMYNHQFGVQLNTPF